MYEREAIERVLAELGDRAGCVSGNLLCQVACVKGIPSRDEIAGAPVCSGTDGEALGKAFPALGYPEGELPAFVAAYACDEQQLRLIIEVLDPELVVAVDQTAGRALAAAFKMPLLAAGAPRTHMGRRFLVVHDFQGSLASMETKRRAWAQLKAARRS